MIRYQTLPEMLEHRSRGDGAIGYLEGEGAEKSLRLSELRRRALGILHHLEALIDGRQLGMQHERWPAGERERLLAVFLGQLDPEVFTVLLGLLKQTLGHVVMVNIDRTNFHGNSILYV